MAILAAGCRRVEWRIVTPRSVAARASHSDVRSLQSEAGLVVRGEGKGHGLPAANVVTVFAAVVMRLGRELAVVRILMAVGTRAEGQPVWSVFALRQVALCASYRCVLPVQRVTCPGMIFHREMRRLPRAFVVAGF